MRKSIFVIISFLSCFLLLFNRCTTSDKTKSNSSEIVLEAESGDIRIPLITAVATDASGGKFIWAPDTPLTYKINVANADTFIIWGRVMCFYGGYDSFNFEINGEAKNWNNIPHSDKWIWVKVYDLSNSRRNDRKVYFMSGENTIKINPREPGGKLDMLLVTNDQNFIPKGTMEEEGKIPPEEKQYYWMEAESVEIAPPFEKEYNHLASAGRCIHIPDVKTRIKFDVTAQGKYILWGRVYAEAGNKNSVKINFDDNPTNTYEVKEFNKWTWVPLASSKGFEKIQLEKGEHELWIKYREEGIKLDQFLLTTDTNYKPENK